MTRRDSLSRSGYVRYKTNIYFMFVHLKRIVQEKRYSDFSEES